MLTLPRSIIEAARVDGAGPLRVFVSVVLPVSRNAIITAALFSFLFAWGDFLFALTLTTGDTVRPVTVGLYLYVGTYVTDWSAAMATAVMASVPAVVLLVIAQRYIAGRYHGRRRQVTRQRRRAAARSRAGRQRTTASTNTSRLGFLLWSFQKRATSRKAVGESISRTAMPSARRQSR